MSFFPTPDPEKLRAAMAQDHAFYHLAATPSPSRASQSDDDDYSGGGAWSSVVTTSQDPYSTSQAFSWPSQAHGLGLESLPTPTQSMFDHTYQAANTYDLTTPWMPTTTAMPALSPFPACTTQEGSSNPSYPFATPLSTNTAWDPIQGIASSLPPATYDSPPSRSEYSTESQQSVIESSPYAHSDGYFQPESTPHIKVEDAMDYQRPRLYSVPGVISWTQPTHVNPGDVYSSPPLTARKQRSPEGVPVSKVESEDVKLFLRPQRPHTRRAVSEDIVAENRQKRGYTTHANSTCHCHLCGKLFQRSYNLKAHMDTHDPHREQPHACPYNGCRRRFVRRTDLIRHEQSVHLRERKYPCPLCNSSFARKDTLRRHVDDGCPRRPEVKKRQERPPCSIDFAQWPGRRNSAQHGQGLISKVEQLR